MSSLAMRPLAYYGGATYDSTGISAGIGVTPNGVGYFSSYDNGDGSLGAQIGVNISSGGGGSTPTAPSYSSPSSPSYGSPSSYSSPSSPYPTPAPPPAPPTCSIQAKPATIQAGSNSTLKWASVRAISAKLHDNINKTPRAVAVKDTKTIHPAQSRTYTLVVTGSGGYKQQCTSSGKGGQTCQWVWVAGRTASCSGTLNVNQSAPQPYPTPISPLPINNDVSADNPSIGPCVTASCDGAGGGSFTDPGGGGGGGVPGGAANLSISASPQLIKLGESSTITWSSNGATSCSVSGPDFSASGTSDSKIATNITEQRIYTLTCKFPFETKTASVTVNISPQWREY